VARNVRTVLPKPTVRADHLAVLILCGRRYAKACGLSLTLILHILD